MTLQVSVKVRVQVRVQVSDLAGELAVLVEPELLGAAAALLQRLQPHQLDVVQAARQRHHAARLPAPQAEVQLPLVGGNTQADSSTSSEGVTMG